MARPTAPSSASPPAPRLPAARRSRSTCSRARDIALPLVGEFQAMNALAALGLAVATGTDAATPPALAALTAVPGRMQLRRRTANGAAGLRRLRPYARRARDRAYGVAARMPRAGSSSSSAPAATATAASGR